MRISDWSSDVCSSDLLMFVLGEPGYYGRFGFSAENAEGFDSPYAGPYFMAIELQGGLPCGPRGLADHAPAFAALAATDPCASTPSAAPSGSRPGARATAPRGARWSTDAPRGFGPHTALTTRGSPRACRAPPHQP